VTAGAIALVAVLAQTRDAAPPGTGTGTITGTITSDETPARPLRRAVVTLNCPDPYVARTAITDDAGRFAFAGLPGGRYALTATRRGWVTMSYGAKAPGRPGRTIPLAAAERATASIRLPRGAVITGSVLDQSGLPVTGVGIRVMRYTYAGSAGERRLTVVGGPSTTIDDRGQYRIFGLPPGEIYVSVVNTGGSFAPSATADMHLTTDVDVQEAIKAVESGPSAPITDVPQRSVGLAPIFFPGATSPAQATPIALRAGEERSGIDFTIQYVPTARVAGTVTMPGAEATPSGTLVNLVVNDPAMPITGPEGFRSTRTGPDGKFEFAQVLPGPYLLVARASIPQPGSTTPQVMSTSMDLDVQSEDQRGLSVMLQDGITLSGAVRWEGEGTAPRLAGLRPNLQSGTPGAGIAVTGGAATVASDGTFTFAGVGPGRYRLTLGSPAQQTPWAVRAATIGGQDALDTPVDIRGSLSDLTIVLTDRVSELSGKADAAISDSTIVLFSANRDHWYGQSRRIMTVRPGRDGAFTFRRVPAGDYALAAVDDAEPGEWYDPSFLQRLLPSAIKLTIAEGEKKVQDLKAGGG